MSKFIQKAAFVALVSVASVTAASAQGVPAGLLRLDSSVAYENANAQATDLQSPKVRSTYARVKKQHAHH